MSQRGFREGGTSGASGSCTAVQFLNWLILRYACGILGAERDERKKQGISKVDVEAFKGSLLYLEHSIEAKATSGTRGKECGHLSNLLPDLLRHTRPHVVVTVRSVQ